MRSTDYVRNLYEYNEWANNLVLKAASALSEEQLGRELGASYGSVRANLVHTVGAQIVWLKRWTGIKSEALALLAGEPSLGAIREAYSMSHRELREFVGSLNEENLEREVRYRDREGKAREGKLWKMMLQIVNHGTQHRAETALALTSLGSSPGDLDYGHFCDIRGSEAPGTLEMIRTLYEYNEWANNKLLEAVSGLSDEELMRPRGVSHGSVGMDMLHQVGGQVGWLSIWQEGAAWIPLPASKSGRFLDNLFDWYARSHEALREFVGSLREEELGRVLMDGNRSMLLWDMMVHVVNHGTQHRSEAAMALTSLGRSPGDLDYVFFELERG